jgi:hypothetical protein
MSVTSYLNVYKSHQVLLHKDHKVHAIHNLKHWSLAVLLIYTPALNEQFRSPFINTNSLYMLKE